MRMQRTGFVGAHAQRAQPYVCDFRRRGAQCGRSGLLGDPHTLGGLAERQQAAKGDLRTYGFGQTL
jgi:hypothetical protein